MTETLITLTSDIVAAHVSNNSVGVEAMCPSLIPQRARCSRRTWAGSRTLPRKLRPEPAVSIRGSVKNAMYIACLDCGKKMKMLKRHLIDRAWA